MKLRALLLACLIATPAQAAVTSLTVEKTTPLAGGYELLEGHFSGALDPNDHAQCQINDISWRRATPPARSNIPPPSPSPAPPARRRACWSMTCPIAAGARPQAIGDGHIDVVSGWQGDLEDGPGVQRIDVPVARRSPARPMCASWTCQPAPPPCRSRAARRAAMGGRTFEVATADGARLYTGVSDDRPTEQK